MRHRTKFGSVRSNYFWNMAILRFFKMVGGGRRYLGFLNFRNFNDRKGQEGQTAPMGAVKFG